MLVPEGQVEPQAYGEVGVARVQDRCEPSMPSPHGVQLAPQWSTPSSATQTPLHLWKPVRQVTSQPPPRQMAVPPGEEGQVSQLGPHEVGESARHWLPQRLKPSAQVNPHVPKTQVAVEFAGGAQGVHELPQVAVALSLTHALPQAWKPTLQLRPHDTPSQVALPLVVVGQAEQLLPQEDRLVSGRH